MALKRFAGHPNQRPQRDVVEKAWWLRWRQVRLAVWPGCRRRCGPAFRGREFPPGKRRSSTDRSGISSSPATSGSACRSRPASPMSGTEAAGWRAACAARRRCCYGLNDTLELRLETDGALCGNPCPTPAAGQARGTADASLGLKWHAMVTKTPASRPSRCSRTWTLDSRRGRIPRAGQGASLRLVAEWELPGDASLWRDARAWLARSATPRPSRYWSGILAATTAGPSWRCAARLQ